MERRPMPHVFTVGSLILSSQSPPVHVNKNVERSLMRTTNICDEVQILLAIIKVTE